MTLLHKMSVEFSPYPANNKEENDTRRTLRGGWNTIIDYPAEKR